MLFGIITLFLVTSTEYSIGALFIDEYWPRGIMIKSTYVLGKRIARGGMAEIYLGKAIGEAAFQRICAIKRILPHYAQDKEFVEMFRDEAHICKRLQHANIVQVYDFTEVEGSYALIMEHVDGCDLRTLLATCETAKTRITIAMALYITANSARALHYAHTKADEITKEALGIVHRDISPQNILISYEGEVKITDFGIASAENKITETRPGVVKGKYSYMSPEQVAAKPLDGRSDIFSLAIVLWEALAMKRLFAGQTEVESIRRVQNCEINYDLRVLNKDVDDELYSIVMKGLAKERKHRYQSAAAFEKDLLRYLHRRYSDFTSSELGGFLKTLLAKKRDKTQDDIKETLSQPETGRERSQYPNRSIPQGIDPGIIDHGRSSVNRSTVKPAPSYHSHNSRAVTHKHGSRTSALPPQYRKNPKQKKREAQLISFILLLGVIGLIFLIRHKSESSKLQIKIHTVPESVLLSINGKRIHNGFTKTPAKISLKPDNYQISLSRPGYQREVIKVKGKNGGFKVVPKVYLRKAANTQLTKVRIVSPNKKIFVNVDNGLYRGTTPLKVELSPNSKHSITFHAGEKGKKALKCSFVLDSRKPQNDVRVVIRLNRLGQKPRCTLK